MIQPIPFPHDIVDSMLDSATVRAINAEWPEHARWTKHHHGHSEKRGSHDVGAFGSVTRQALEQLNAADFVQRVGAAFGVSCLSADGGLYGGGLHESFTGGFLDIHADFNIHPETGLARRVNLLVFLNENWLEEWAGALELWGPSSCLVRIEPMAGRASCSQPTTPAFTATRRG